MTSPLLAASGIRKAYHTRRDRVEVLRGIDLSVDPGEFVAIVGRSGSGKSTLLYCLCGLLKPDAGSISICGQHVTGQSNAQLARLRRDHVGMGHERTKNLSGGQRQRVAIARALLRRPDILFADEPTGSLDPSTAQSVMQLLRHTVTPNSALVMVTHDLDIAATADRVVVLSNGICDDVLTHPTVEQLFELTQEEVG